MMNEARRPACWINAREVRAARRMMEKSTACFKAVVFFISHKRKGNKDAA
jgi:hypothetical protein